MEVDLTTQPEELRRFDIDGQPFEELVKGARVVRIPSDDPEGLAQIWGERLIEFRERQMEERVQVAEKVIALCHDASPEDLALYLCSAKQLSVIFHQKKRECVVVGSSPS